MDEEEEYMVNEDSESEDSTSGEEMEDEDNTDLWGNTCDDSAESENASNSSAIFTLKKQKKGLLTSKLY